MSMPKNAILFGVILIVLSLVGYGMASAGVGAVAVDGAKKGPSPTLFIPAGFGVILVVCGVIALKDHLRKHAMHAAAAIALIGGLVSGGRGASALLRAPDPDKPVNMLATASVWTMAVVCLLFVGLCVQSFMAAAKARRLAAKQSNS
jgi:hypothetical protein